MIAIAHGSSREFDELPGHLRENSVGVLCARYLENRDHSFLEQAGLALTGSRNWYTFLGRMF
jgi:hypothetical protein